MFNNIGTMTAAEALLQQHPARADKLIRRWMGDTARFAGV